MFKHLEQVWLLHKHCHVQTTNSSQNCFISNSFPIRTASFQIQILLLYGNNRRIGPSFNKSRVVEDVASVANVSLSTGEAMLFVLLHNSFHNSIKMNI